jgi:hypothetical protein
MVLLAISSALAEEYLDGNQLLQLCEDNAEPRGACIGYVVGIADLLMLFTYKGVTLADADGNGMTAGFNWCRPAGVTNEQLADVVASYLRDHPEKRHLSALSQVVPALRDTFPCG